MCTKGGLLDLDALTLKFFNMFSTSLQILGSCTLPASHFGVMGYLSMVPSGFRLTMYTHLVPTILVPSGICIGFADYGEFFSPIVTGQRHGRTKGYAGGARHTWEARGDEITFFFLGGGDSLIV